jgi:3-hydroxyacyl-[acyl-carrier-protein] dehydratase
LNSMEIREILSYLPHRYPFLLLDRVISCEPGKNIVALKNVAVGEPFFQGHFPENPIMPGVMILEAMAQAAAILSYKTLQYEDKRNLLYYFVGIDNARFKKPVVPGDQLEIEVHLERHLRGISRFRCEARVEGKVVAEATILCSMRAIAPA